MTTNDPEEIARLRRVAYSREGTDADRLHLAELESSAPAVEEADEIASEAESAPEAEEAAAAPASTRLRLVAIAALAGVIVGATGVALGTALVPATPPTTVALPTASPTAVPELVVTSDSLPSLSVFDREATALDDLGGGFSVVDWFDDRLTNIDVRWIGSAESSTVYAVRGLDDDVPQVCVIVMRTLEGTSRCVSEARFLADGIQFSGMGLQVRWGPTGTGLWVRVS